MEEGTKAQTKTKEQESSSTVDRKSVSSSKNTHFENGVINSLLSKKKSHPDVLLRNRAVKYTHALAGLSNPTVTWYSEVWVLWSLGTLRSLPYICSRTMCSWHMMQKKSLSKAKTEQWLQESHRIMWSICSLEVFHEIPPPPPPP